MAPPAVIPSGSRRALMAAAAVVMCLLVAGAPVAAEITCTDVAIDLTTCIPYVERGGAVPPSCCDGIRTLKAEASTTPDRQAVCKCLKTFASSFPGLDPGLAAGLPAKCGVNVGFPISFSTDCSKIR